MSRCRFFFTSVFFSVTSLNALSQIQQRNNINYDSLRRVLENMYNEDQEIRRVLVDSVGFNSPQAGVYIAKMLKIDVQNQKEIKTILEKYGWLERSKIGEKASEALFLIVQHSNLEFMDNYFPQLKRMVDKGEASPVDCAKMEDRILMYKREKQIYGTQATDELRPDKKYAIWPIQNPSQVNELRRRAGFTTTIEEQAKEMNAEYNQGEELPKKKQ